MLLLVWIWNSILMNFTKYGSFMWSSTNDLVLMCDGSGVSLSLRILDHMILFM